MNPETIQATDCGTPECAAQIYSAFLGRYELLMLQSLGPMGVTHGEEIGRLKREAEAGLAKWSREMDRRSREPQPA